MARGKLGEGFGTPGRSSISCSEMERAKLRMRSRFSSVTGAGLRRSKQLTRERVKLVRP